MGWGRVSPAPWALLGPDRFECGPQAFVSPSLVIPGSVDVLHIGLLSAVRLHRAADFLSFGVPS